MLTLDRHPKSITVTSLSDLWFRGQRSKKGQITNNPKMEKVKVSACSPWTDIQNCPRWPLRLTYRRSSGQRSKTCQHICVEQKSGHIHGDISVWPMVKGKGHRKGKWQTYHATVSGSVYKSSLSFPRCTNIPYVIMWFYFWWCSNIHCRATLWNLYPQFSTRYVHRADVWLFHIVLVINLICFSQV